MTSLRIKTFVGMLLLSLCGGFLPATWAALPVVVATNTWTLGTDETIERILFVTAPAIHASGEAKNDTFWLSQADITLDGQFNNDVWAFGDTIRLGGHFADHVRAVGRSLVVHGRISNGLWAAATSISTTTNAWLGGDHFITADTVSLLGTIDGNLVARGRQITLGGHINGEVYLYGDDIVVRPGTTVSGSLNYITIGQPVVLDATSHVEGKLRKIDPPTGETFGTGLNFYWQLYWFIAALLTGLPFVLIFPRFTGLAVQQLRGNLLKSGMVGLAALLLGPVLIIMTFVTIIGIPFSFVLGSGFGLFLYLGKFPVALAIGTALLQHHKQVSLPSALLALVIGLVVVYGLAMIPYAGSSLQTAASAIGFGSLLLTLAAGRGGAQDSQQKSQTSTLA